MKDIETSNLPLILAGPLIRQATPKRFCLWLVTSQPCQLTLSIYDAHHQVQQQSPLTAAHVRILPLGKKAYVHFIDYPCTPHLTEQALYFYDLSFKPLDLASGQLGPAQGLVHLLPHLVYPQQRLPSFYLSTELTEVLHGSCRKPHAPCADALVAADAYLAQSITSDHARPNLFLMSGDQIYADDVCGPMLQAIIQVIAHLDLHAEVFSGACVENSQALHTSPLNYYQREKLLPQSSKALKESFFKGVEKPIFTSDQAHNHLVTFAELAAMYLLVWSPQLWSSIHWDLQPIPKPFRRQFKQELRLLQPFIQGLAQVQRLLAHIPTYMIFDDHDVTDDWNLTRAWEETAHENPFSRQIIGNSLMAYWIFQGWGNAPEKYPATWYAQFARYAKAPTPEHHNQVLQAVFAWEAWDYQIETQPKIRVLDTRTQRWWSESEPHQPSGLMDWEALSQLQADLIGQDAVILVSPAPIFGVKLIENVQRIFTTLGYALMVDAENWMAHPGAAHVMLNIFTHPQTPQNFIVLSGDVHYSFAYDIQLKRRKNSPHIWQITASGFKNEFPHKLLSVLDPLNTRLYASRSPLNYLTKRHFMRIHARTPEHEQRRSSERLLNTSGVGVLRLTPEGAPAYIGVLRSDGELIEFTPAYQD
ncbi:hypothetical protein SAMN05421831_11235 [Allopseudospirillum japonicum]|uniref:PhoD-like phosphatase n=1 Tax=Allopseudospirillum japonicum TaxID=64971 RepID=A0A1H6TV04_9GAMM|nr:alkaline phosphatase D family protein [Allopseudospirillum japonicum]SEI83841.1 hypothetical protein SAMN05421831_11235 [Allopseudospirillum japonicum]